MNLKQKILKYMIEHNDKLSQALNKTVLDYNLTPINLLYHYLVSFLLELYVQVLAPLFEQAHPSHLD